MATPALEFALRDQTITARLSAFLERWLPRLPPAPAIVLALCNPHRARLSGPPDIHHALGSVDSWLDRGDSPLFAGPRKVHLMSAHGGTFVRADQGPMTPVQGILPQAVGGTGGCYVLQTRLPERRSVAVTPAVRAS